MYNADMESQEDKEIMRKAAINGLAVVGFVALIVAGLSLAVYSTRFVPAVVNGIGAAAVYLGSSFSPAPNISVVPTETAPSTIFFGTNTSNASSNELIINGNAGTGTTTPPKKTTTTAGTKTSAAYQISGATTPALYGLSDLVVNITAVGYLDSASTDSFIASSTVPFGNRPAVTFTIKNIGTNASGQWRFSAVIPTQTAYIYQSQLQQSLLPGDSIDYILGFDQANKGANQPISITANFDKAIGESNMNNNSASTKVTILGS